MPLLRRCFVLVLAATALLIAQEGHPLTGTWSGDWGPSVSQRTHLTVIMNWDGKRVSGTVNPGPNAFPLGDVSVDFTTWTVRIQAAGKDGAIAAEGRIENLASAHRSIKGTWKQGAVSGDFRLTRD